MRIIEDIVRVKKEGEKDLPKSFSVVKKTAILPHSRKKTFAKNIKRKTKKPVFFKS